MIFESTVPGDCTCVWLHVTGDEPGFVLHNLSSTCGVHRNLRWYQPTFTEAADAEVTWEQRGAEE